MAEYHPDRAETVDDNVIFISIRPRLKFNFTYQDRFLELFCSIFDKNKPKNWVFIQKA